MTLLSFCAVHDHGECACWQAYCQLASLNAFRNVRALSQDYVLATAARLRPLTKRVI